MYYRTPPRVLYKKLILKVAGKVKYMYNDMSTLHVKPDWHIVSPHDKLHYIQIVYQYVEFFHANTATLFTKKLLPH